MNIETIVKQRRAIFPKQMNGGQVPQKEIEKMLELANWAPTHRNTEPWRFKVYANNRMDELIELCKDCYTRETPSHKFNSVKIGKMEERKKQVSHIIAICMKRDTSPNPLPEFEEIAATAMAVQNLWLYLSSTKKYGGYWSSPSYAMGPEFHKFLELEPDEKCLGLFYIGEMDDKGSSHEGRRGIWRDKVEFVE